MVSLSRGDKAIRDGVDRHLVPLNWFDDPCTELADRICLPGESVPCPVPTLDSGSCLEVFEVALTDVGQEPYQPFFVIPFHAVTACEIESEFDCFACYRAIRSQTGNEWEDFDYRDGQGAFNLVPEQGTIYVRYRDLVRKRGEVFREDVVEQVTDFLERGYIYPGRNALDDVVLVKESFMAMYFDE